MATEFQRHAALEAGDARAADVLRARPAAADLVRDEIADQAGEKGRGPRNFAAFALPREERPHVGIPAALGPQLGVTQQVAGVAVKLDERRQSRVAAAVGAQGQPRRHVLDERQARDGQHVVDRRRGGREDIEVVAARGLLARGLDAQRGDDVEAERPRPDVTLQSGRAEEPGARRAAGVGREGIRGQEAVVATVEHAGEGQPMPGHAPPIHDAACGIGQVASVGGEGVDARVGIGEVAPQSVAVGRRAQATAGTEIVVRFVSRHRRHARGAKSRTGIGQGSRPRQPLRPLEHQQRQAQPPVAR